MSRPIVSVLTPCHNAVAYVGTTIASVKGQTVSNLEMVVVDDGSTDQSAQAVHTAAADDSRIRLIRTANSGVARARNTAFGASNSCTIYLLFLDADDILESAMLATLVDHMERHPEVGMAYCGFTLINDVGQPLSLPAGLDWFARYAHVSKRACRLDNARVETPFEAVFTAPVLLPSISLIRRSVYEQTPGFDESFGHLFEDADLFLQIAIRSEVHRIDQSLVRYRRHSAQSTSNADKVASQRAKLDRKWHDLPGLTEAQRETVRRAEWFRDYPLAAHLGAKAGWQHLWRGNVRQGIQFLGGAARRYARSLFGPNFKGAS